jgi:hypothetical protein
MYNGQLLALRQELSYYVHFPENCYPSFLETVDYSVEVIHVWAAVRDSNKANRKSWKNYAMMDLEDTGSVLSN